MSDEIIPVPKFRPALLVVLDGFGVAPDSEGNGVTRAKMPVFHQLIQKYPTMTLRASGEEVGLSWGEMGNSEVGHLAIGSGRVYYQTFPRINRDIVTGTFYENPAFLKAFEHARTHNSAIHLVGMVSAGRVHSMDEHCHALLECAKRQKVNRVYVHAILDGRDTIYNVGMDFIRTLQSKMAELGVGKIATLSGRFYAMDRDNRWDRTEKAYNAMVLGQGEQATDPFTAIEASYAKEIFDEQFVPTVMIENGAPVARIQENDAVIFFNFRPDRARQLTKAFVLPTFDVFPRTFVKNLFAVTMTEYEKNLPVEVAFRSERVEQCLAQVLSQAGLKQLHIAETEKYAHVTFFLNGTKEDPFPGEDRVIIPSPRVSSYDQAPEMSAIALTDRVLKEINSDTYDFMVMNFANPDMVSHTGNLEATLKANETVDGCLGRLVEGVLQKNGVVFMTSDHGNAEEVRNLRTGEMDKEHSTNPVPFLVIAKSFEGVTGLTGEIPEGDLSFLPPVGMLADVAPTILSVLGIPQPPEMTGQSLL
ncbi:MAG: 2,3-bisphosphoglycerate-independent phosphoglycerate mutase [Candidatus Uhrbacteria bacterium GW2011_GWF2_41_16]|uniref:2,3-bisphosphoglycerate-independent phosphoglycerate mutase n=2 Tax=Candidatus Uhriibacteriota TaxID=1752732 RepID=A0A0G0VFY6_9BACT|nr:MAG: 2,3-bisphosphoglycerate-independent phosphoglycerate mutase [Candidatus Uhrbacteria bacterium GW2011_GWA2_41_10]KKR87581.1 MAG: 2,3-bisphosphoglycerate-independent phosphoglycerate mutase [Candidatus Uhrbacteria bacterium GW2011_GWC2_41_11]KKR98561.1 MAG: 2,3-bisphosphoglycerate-independent phosphoglycerate mutase [Candidatus Uhrbacteria bacterium GW2011_GWF2_41_16]HBO99818.1 2,3-bisphosphoglycerate-independent phosphoglycerate mutase [Candidatus Uhrbacteria bacterium]